MKKEKVVKLLIISLILVFLGLFFIYQNGYYENMVGKKTKLTNEQIEKFESDVKEGRDVLINDYIEKEINYQTKSGNASLKIANKIESVIDTGIKFLFRKISTAIE